MTATRHQKAPGNQKPNHEFIHHGYIRGTSSEEPARRGFLYILNALAFSTLLSSQETDAHLWRNLRSPPGQPLNFTLESPSCQLRLPEATRKLKPHGGSSRHQG